MVFQKRWNFGIGTFFSLLVAYFIYLYSKEKNWALLAFLSKWYLIIVGGFMILSFAVILLVLILTLAIFLIASVKSKPKNKNKSYIDAEYQIKE